MELQKMSESKEAQLRWRTLEDCLNLALQWRISSKSWDAEQSSHRLCLRLVWLLLHSGFHLRPDQAYHYQQLSRDLSKFLDQRREQVLRPSRSPEA